MSLCNCEKNILLGIRQKPIRRFNSSLLELTAWNKRAMKVKWMGGKRKNQFQPLNKTRKTKIWGFPDFWHVCLLAMRISKTLPLTQIGITELCEIVNVKWHWQLVEKWKVAQVAKYRKSGFVYTQSTFCLFVFVFVFYLWSCSFLQNVGKHYNGNQAPFIGSLSLIFVISSPIFIRPCCWELSQLFRHWQMSSFLSGSPSSRTKPSQIPSITQR